MSGGTSGGACHHPDFVDLSPGKLAMDGGVAGNYSLFLCEAKEICLYMP